MSQDMFGNKGRLPALVVFVVATLVVTYAIITRYFGIPDGPGEVGDLFGGANALFSGLAFAGLLLALSLQREELGLQREELKQTRFELRGQREQLTMQNATLSQEREDDRFFRLLTLLNETTRSIEIRHPSADASGLVRGRACLLECYTELYRTYESWRKSHAENATDSHLLKPIFSEFASNHDTLIGHYFDTLFETIAFVGRASSSELYAGVLASQLSAHEKCLLFYACLSDRIPMNVREYVVKLGLLRGMPLSGLIIPNHLSLIDLAAFGSMGPGRQGSSLKEKPDADEA